MLQCYAYWLVGVTQPILGDGGGNPRGSNKQNPPWTRPKIEMVEVLLKMVRRRGSDVGHLEVQLV